MKLFSYKKNDDGSIIITLFPKEKKEVPKQIKTNTLFICFTNGKCQSWSIEPFTGNIILKPWWGFYKWFYFRKSPYYSIKYNGGSTTIKREMINYFNINVENRRQ